MQRRHYDSETHSSPAQSRPLIFFISFAVGGYELLHRHLDLQWVPGVQIHHSQQHSLAKCSTARIRAAASSICSAI